MTTFLNADPEKMVKFRVPISKVEREIRRTRSMQMT